MFKIIKDQPRRRSRLAQLSKANRLARRNGPINEFLAMARAAEGDAHKRVYLTRRRDHEDYAL